MSLLGISEILELVVNTLTADDKYSPRNTKNLPQLTQIHLRNKFIFSVFAAFLKFPSNFEHFFKKHGPDSLCISGLRNSKRRGWLND